MTLIVSGNKTLSLQTKLMALAPDLQEAGEMWFCPNTGFLKVLKIYAS